MADRAKDVISDDFLSEGIRSLAEAAESRLSHHPAPEDLVAYHQRKTTDEHANEIQGHLAVCSECTELYLDLVDMVEGTAEKDESTGWQENYQAVQKRLRESAPGPVALDSGQKRPENIRTPRLAYAAAAVALVAAGLLGWRTLHLEEQLRDQAAPRFNVAIHDLLPVNASRTAPTAEITVLSLEEDRLVLILNPSETSAFSEYIGRLRYANGEEIWSAQGLRPTEFGNFTLEISRRYFSSDAYQIEIYGVRDGEETLLDSYAFRIE